MNKAIFEATNEGQALFIDERRNSYLENKMNIKNEKTAETIAAEARGQKKLNMILVAIPIWIISALALSYFAKMPDTPEQAALKIEQAVHKEQQKKIEAEQEAKDQSVRDAENIRLMAISNAQMILESALREPDSVEYIVKSYNIGNNALCFKYRAKNGFGGFGVETVVFYDGTSDQSAKAYKKLCPSVGNYEKYAW